jgi:hypothetical protein
MSRCCNPARQPAVLTSLLPVACAALLLAFSAYGCKHSAHTSDSRLQKIDEMLSVQLPSGTPRARVEFFITSRGYKLEDSPDRSSLVAVVRHVDTDTLQPVTARATFHFDAGDKLISFDLQPAPDAPLQP